MRRGQLKIVVLFSSFRAFEDISVALVVSSSASVSIVCYFFFFHDSNQKHTSFSKAHAFKIRLSATKRLGL